MLNFCTLTLHWPFYGGVSGECRPLYSCNGKTLSIRPLFILPVGWVNLHHLLHTAGLNPAKGYFTDSIIKKNKVSKAVNHAFKGEKRIVMQSEIKTDRKKWQTGVSSILQYIYNFNTMKIFFTKIAVLSEQQFLYRRRK